MAQFGFRGFVASAAGIGLAVGMATAAFADDCSRFNDARDNYLGATAAGMTQALDQMARQRDIPVDVAAFYWGGTLLQADDARSLDSLAQLTLASYGWPGNASRAETTMTRIADEHGSASAALFAGLMFSDQSGTRDSYRARAYLVQAARQGNRDAVAFLPMYDACYARNIALN
jgi:hypothetical protein